MKPILKTKSISPHLKVKSRAIVESGTSYRINPGQPVGLLLALTYNEVLVPFPQWTSSLLEPAPLWGQGISLTSPRFVNK